MLQFSLWILHDWSLHEKPSQNAPQGPEFELLKPILWMDNILTRFPTGLHAVRIMSALGTPEIKGEHTAMPTALRESHGLLLRPLPGFFAEHSYEPRRLGKATLFVSASPEFSCCVEVRRFWRFEQLQTWGPSAPRQWWPDHVTRRKTRAPLSARPGWQSGRSLGFAFLVSAPNDLQKASSSSR